MNVLLLEEELQGKLFCLLAICLKDKQMGLKLKYQIKKQIGGLNKGNHYCRECSNKLNMLGHLN